QAAVRGLLVSETAHPAVAATRRRPAWWQAAALAAGCAALSFALGLWVARPAGGDDEAEQAVARHVASVGGRQPLIEVASSDRHVVKPWFAGKIDFAPPVRDLSPAGFTLV